MKRQWKKKQNTSGEVGKKKNIRMSYSRQKEVLEMPNLIEVQKGLIPVVFLDEGLKRSF